MRNEQLEDNDQEQEHLDRGIPSVSSAPGDRTMGIGQKLLVAVMAICVILSLIAVNGGFSKKDDDTKKIDTKIESRLGPPPNPPKKNTPEEIVTEDPIPPLRTSRSSRLPETKNGKDENKEITPEERKLTSSVLGISSQRSESQDESTGDQISISENSEVANDLSASLKPTKISGSRASVLTEPSFFITQGTFIDCALETAISSDVPGMTRCRTTTDVYSTDNKVLLLERGTKIVGQYTGGMKRGKARIFVLWTRAETPNGVLINLDSPGTDSLGRSGHSGFIDTHFWERFGGAIMLSLIDDIGTGIANSLSADGENNIQFGSSTDTAKTAGSIALENSINIPPTLIKNQGEHINIFVARDLDFRGVYELELTK